jgi:hypothetical protein
MGYGAGGIGLGRHRGDRMRVSWRRYNICHIGLIKGPAVGMMHSKRIAMPVERSRMKLAALCALAWAIAFAGIRFASLGI